MNETTLPNLQANERAFTDGENIVKVVLCRCKPNHDREVRIGVQAFVGEIHSPMVSRAIDISALACGQCSLKPAFWKKWVNMRSTASAYNVEAPNMEAGTTIEYDGATWHAGVGKPDDAMGAIKDFYLDKGTGQVYRKRPGEAEHFARLAAQQMFTRLAELAAYEEMDLPEM